MAGWLDGCLSACLGAWGAKSLYGPCLDNWVTWQHSLLNVWVAAKLLHGWLSKHEVCTMPRREPLGLTLVLLVLLPHALHLVGLKHEGMECDQCDRALCEVACSMVAKT